jgi:hypothetical protein
MPLMCCDSCSEIEFKPVSLGTNTYFCVSCKAVSSHTSIGLVTDYKSNAIGTEDLIFHHEVLPIVETFYGDQFRYEFEDEHTDHFSTVTYTGVVPLQEVRSNLLTPSTTLNKLLMFDQINKQS